ncbi:hypothetical protein SLE2022_112920 [Rubroshorea leprosula]
MVLAGVARGLWRAYVEEWTEEMGEYAVGLLAVESGVWSVVSGPAMLWIFAWFESQGVENDVRSSPPAVPQHGAGWSHFCAGGSFGLQDAGPNSFF